MARALRWPRSARANRWLDLLLSAVVIAIGLGGSIAAGVGVPLDSAPPGPAIVVGAVLTGVVLWWRRTHPLAVVAGLVVLIVVVAGVVPPGLYGVQVALAVVTACFALGAWCERRGVVVAVGVGLVVLTVLGAADGNGGLVAAVAVALALIALPVVTGTAARSRRRELEEVEARLAESERRQDERARLAIQDERNRIARELHDVVAHHVSLIGVQAGAARASLDASPDATRRALAAIEESSRAAVGEMRQLVEVLRPDSGAPRAPQPSLADLDELVHRWRGAGFDIALDAPPSTAVADVAPTLSSSCYRLVEEALTNVARHSRARRASVAVHPLPATIEIAVRDPGPAVAVAVREPAGGRGLVGMAERAALFGGTVAAGPTPDGGFAVLASLPRVAAP